VGNPTVCGQADSGVTDGVVAMGEPRADSGLSDAPRSDLPGAGAVTATTPWPPRASGAERIGQAAVAVVLAALIGVGMWLPPDPSGVGTHTAFGLPPCGMLVATGHPCPTCGATTSFALAAHGRFYEALVNQPFGLVVFLAALSGLGFSVFTCVTSRTWVAIISPHRVVGAVILLVIIALVSWAYKWSMM
jgi:hypothetical protein